MRAGARDLVLKGSLGRLAMALRREVNEAKLRRAQRRQSQLMAQTQLIARAGGWEWTREGDQHTWTEGIAQVLEAPPGSVPTRADVLGCLADGELERVRSFFRTPTEVLDLDLRVTSMRGRALVLRVVARVEWRDGRAERLVGAVHDVTERRQLEGTLRQNDRLVAMGTIAAGVAHEINNPLTHLVASLPIVLDAARRGAAPDDEVTGLLQGCLDGAQRIAAIVRDLKVFTRPDEAGTRCDVGEVLTSVLNLLNLEYRHAARIVRAVPVGVQVAAPSARVAQVLTNLIINAVQAMPPRPVDENLIEVCAREEGDSGVIEVRDNGSGISDQVRARLFTPFFTTKPVGEGTGLGLSVCRTLVTGLGGTIDVESTEGAGSTFTVRLPLEPGARAVAAPPRREATGRALRVLVVDDEAMLRKLTARALRPHEVVEAESVDEALEVIGANAAFDAVLCDLMMPRRPGADLYRHLCEHRPALAARCLFVSGGAVTREAETFLQSLPPDRLVLKPFTVEQLRSAVERVAPP
jgi:C4-dicarboxylate-specific signal transduction histidine kinase